ncbi:unnamed protein product [Jaminaea pallidilutea]
MPGFFDMSRIQGKVVFITGASGGIGKSTAVLFARLGANVVLAARRKEQLEQVAEECVKANKEGGTGQGGKTHVAIVDMMKRSQIEEAKANLPDWAQQVDVLVNNSGLVLGVDKVGSIDADEIDVMIQTNVVGLIHLTQLFVADFKKRQSGHVIMLGSIAGREAYPGGSIYCTTKFAVAAFTSSLMKELVDTPIRVTEIQPGMVETDFSTTRYRGDKDAAAKVYQGLEPLTGDDIAEEIVWAASRKPHVNVAQTLVFPVNQASPYHNARPLLKKE